MNTIIYLVLLAISVHHFFWFQDELGFAPEIALISALVLHIVSVAFWRLVLAQIPDLIGGTLKLLLAATVASFLAIVFIILFGHTHIILSVLK